MNKEIPVDSTRQALGNVTNTLGKRPFPLDPENPKLKGKETIGWEKSASSEVRRRTGNYFCLERSGGFTKENHGSANNNRGWYFSNLMNEPGAQGSDPKGREESPDSELFLEEEYDSENEESLKHNMSCSSKAFIAPNSEGLKLGCTGGLERSCNCSFCVKALKRSRRLSRLLEGKLHAQQFNRKVLGESSKQLSKMELELTYQWRSLFQHTENIFSRESSDLHSTLLNLEELRENCKRDLHSVSDVSVPRNG